MSPNAWTPGPRNLLTDLDGIRVGNASDETLRSGTTVVLFDEPAVASSLTLGGAPGTRDTELLDPTQTVSQVDAIVLSGGSAFGLDAASGVQAHLRAENRGFEVAGMRVPIVPGAILFDLANGGDKDWGLWSPYREFGWEAARNAGSSFDLGTAGAGTGATTATVRGGLGSASTILPSGLCVAALVAVNAVGSPLVGGTSAFWAAPFELDGEFGAGAWPSFRPGEAMVPRTKFDPRPGTNTTIGLIATNAVLTKAGCKRLAVAAHDGFARALYPAHTDFDGDLVFAAATGRSGIAPSPVEGLELASAASATMARAIARGVFHARSRLGDTLPAWRDMA
ncbi:P1 family peptidase [Aureimonas sp. ME7]|uniref:P1 family peptidase n=1 Tax=Aureimonas sp. ME7 TaxID=2744252 RepID=UPI001FCE6C57|nr:P1 family peptidase [Aureimonas sp. ME7]